MIASYNREQKDRLVNAFICEFEAGGRREVLVLPIVPDGMESTDVSIQRVATSTNFKIPSKCVTCA